MGQLHQAATVSCQEDLASFMLKVMPTLFGICRLASVIRLVAEVTLPRSGHGLPFEKAILKVVTFFKKSEVGWIISRSPLQLASMVQLAAIATITRRRP